MSVEYQKTKEEALEKLRSFCVSNLKRIQADSVQTEFSFNDSWGHVKQDESIHPQIPVLNQLSRSFFSFDKHTWVTYRYKDGVLSAELFQNVNGSARSVQLHEPFDVEDIPFDKFSEDRLIKAAKTIEKYLPRNQSTQ